MFGFLVGNAGDGGHRGDAASCSIKLDNGFQQDSPFRTDMLPSFVPAFRKQSLPESGRKGRNKEGMTSGRTL